MRLPPPPLRLRCEHLDNPLGLDAARPVLSWVVEHENRGEVLRAFQVLVSSSEEMAMAERGDVWDSGRLENEGQFCVVYGGPALGSSRRYFWRVRWWDSSNLPSPFSRPAHFETGILEAEEWRARWIGPHDWPTFVTTGTTLLGRYLGDTVQALGVYLRKEFTLDGRPRAARAYVCGLGHGELRLNGSRVGGHALDPAWTDYRKLALYSTFDVTDFLRQGPNAAGLILGNGRHLVNYGYGLPRAFVQVEVELEDGRCNVVATDESWSMAEGPLRENGLYFGEVYDARREMPGWDEPGFDDRSWQPATLREATRLASQAIPPVRVVERLRPRGMSSPHPGTYLFDFGQNFSGWVCLTVRGPAGTAVRLRHGELLHEDGTLNVAPNQNAAATDVYICRGQGTEVYEPRFTYHGFRYVEVTGFPGVPTLESLEGCFVHTDVEPSGQFHVSHDLINSIHRNIRWGYLSNLVGIPTDCPQRDERHGWLGDARLAAEQAFFNFDMTAFYAKFLEDIRLAQKEDGSLPDVVPPYLAELYPADPSWASAYAALAWLAYWHSGDRRILEGHYSPLKRYMEYLKSASEGYIQRSLGKYGDWCPPGSIPPKKTPVELTATWSFYHDAILLARMALALGLDDEAEYYRRLCLDIKDAFNAAFLTDEGYVSVHMSPVERIPSQTSNALPLALDMVPADRRGLVLGKLLTSVVDHQDGHLDTGILGTAALLDVLTDSGHADVAFRVATQKTYPGWGYMVAEGATTLWERWEKVTGGGMNSHNHIMLGSVDAWFYRTIAGIACREPGWKRFRVRPYPFPGLRFAVAELQTVRGGIFVSWQRSEDAFRLTVRVPVSSEARVELPLLWPRFELREGYVLLGRNGQSLAEATGISFHGTEGDRLVLNLASGDYDLILSPAANSFSGPRDRL